MDQDDSGYVPWKSFTRVLLSVAPKHLLRSDVTSFLATQVDNEDDLINYKEFLITGKVLIIESKEGVKEVLARSWYARQRGNKALSEGDSSSMYTWKNHLKWYSKRKSDAVIWLIRRANRAIQYYKYVETARDSLLKYGKWGKDLAYLMECGERALQAIESSDAIRISLQDRIIHAMKYKMKREEARRSLFTIGQASLRGGLETVSMKKDEPTKQTSQIVFPKLSQIYKIKYLKENAFRVLLKYSKIAKDKVEFRENAFLWLQKLGRKTLRQHEVMAMVHNQLVACSDKARNYCMTIDSALIFLLTRGERALKHFDKQTATLNFLIQYGQRSIIFTEKKAKVAQELSAFAQSTFNKLNRRENSFAYLCKRAKNSQKLLAAKKEAYWMLTGFMRKIYQNEENLMNTFLWLKKRADRAKKHTEQCLKAHRRLKTIAQRSVAVSRARSMAHADLKQIGQQALRKQFEDTWVVLPGNKQRLNDEIKRIKTNDKRLHTTRAELPEEERWRVVLMDAFIGLASAYTKEPLAQANSERNLNRAESIERPSSTRNRPNSPESAKSRPQTSDQQILSESLKRPSSPESAKHRPLSPEPSSRTRPNSGSNKLRPGTANSNLSEESVAGLELGRLGFKKLILDGKLLGLPKGTADSCYESVDSDASGCVSFSEVWTWFLYQARAKTKKSPGSIQFHIEQILPPKERAITALMKRFVK